MCVCGIGPPPPIFVLSRYWGGWSVPCPQAPVAYFLDIISHEKWMFKYLCHFLPIHVKRDSFNNLGLQEGTCIYCLCNMQKMLVFCFKKFFCFVLFVYEPWVIAHFPPGSFRTKECPFYFIIRTMFTKISKYHLLLDVQRFYIHKEILTGPY